MHVDKRMHINVFIRWFHKEDKDEVGQYSEHDSASNLYVTDKNVAVVSTKTAESSVSSLCLLLKL